ncbi:uncharacterized protein LOC135484301 [Lineus longissimus]|uniref:uncharacterized protein LOC135484301 n=1 Tax=Lineus longissimus TaxID=88925 RepID=UPI002B4EF416
MESVHVIVLIVPLICLIVQYTHATGTPPVRAANCKECMFCQVVDKKMSLAASKTEVDLNLTECANKCLTDNTCKSVTWKKATLECSLFTSNSNSNSNLAAETGTEYWGYDSCSPSPTYTCA